MKFMKFVPLFLFGAFCCTSHAYENKHPLSESDFMFQKQGVTESNKMYVSMDQLAITENGMYLLYSEAVLPISALFRDHGGLYVIRDQLESGNTQNECPKGHPSPHGDGRCNQRKCPHFRG